MPQVWLELYLYKVRVEVRGRELSESSFAVFFFVPIDICRVIKGFKFDTHIIVKRVVNKSKKSDHINSPFKLNKNMRYVSLG